MSRERDTVDRTPWETGKAILADPGAKWRTANIPRLSDAVKRELRGMEIVRKALGIDSEDSQ